MRGTICWHQSSDKVLQVYRRPLSDGSVAVVALNRGAGHGAGVGRESDGDGGSALQPWAGPVVLRARSSGYLRK